MSTPSDGEIVDAIREYLIGADLDNITTKGMRNDIEKKVNCDLSHKKEFLKETLLKCMDELENNEEGDSDDDDDENDNDTRETSSKRRNNGFNKLLQLSNELSEFMGKPFAQRTEVSKEVWIYIKANNLQNPKDKREILCDDKFRSLFKREKMGMFKMNKYLSEMMKNFEDLQDNTIVKIKEKPIKVENKIKEEKLDKKSKKRNLDSNEVDDIKSKKKKKVKKENGEKKEPNINNPFNKPMKLSSSLSSLIKSEIESRPQIVKKLWEYIHSNNLQNPNDKRQIINDKSMENIFKVKNMSMFEMNKLLSVHLTNIE
jgi:upstream activation factor subunit UAF30